MTRAQNESRQRLTSTASPTSGGHGTRTRKRAPDFESSGTAEKPRENNDSREIAAPGAAVDAQNVFVDPELRSIIARWPDLPNAIKAGIVAMVSAADEAGKT